MCVCDDCFIICNRHLDIEEERQRQTESVPDEMFHMNSEHTMATED